MQGGLSSCTHIWRRGKKNIIKGFKSTGIIEAIQSARLVLKKI